MNIHILTGHLGGQPEFLQFEGGSRVAKVSLAEVEWRKDENDPSGFSSTTFWHNLVAWGFNADKLSKLSTGDRLTVHGKTRTREYTNKEGEKRYITEFTVETIEVMKKKEEHANDAERSPNFGGFPEGEDDDLPF